MNTYFLLAALAGFTAVIVHDVVGHRIIMTPLTRDQLFATRAFGDADMSRRVLLVAWHLTTAAFACSAVAMALLAFGAVTGTSLPRFVSVLHASFLLIGLSVVGGRPTHLLRPVPVAFVTCMSAVVLFGWLGSQ